MIERQYGLSPRLVGFMLTNPPVLQRRQSTLTEDRHSSFRQRASNAVSRSHSKSSPPSEHDLEMMASVEEREQSTLSSEININHYQIVNDPPQLK